MLESLNQTMTLATAIKTAQTAIVLLKTKEISNHSLSFASASVVKFEWKHNS